MTQPHLAVRRAVRDALRDVPPDQLVLVACSGGADSLVLAATVADVAGRDGRRAGGVTVDHGLQAGSAERARGVAADLVRLGLDPVEVIQVRVPDDLHGPEGNARRARYAALDAAAKRHAGTVLLGHTLDDQAETVLLGLARGSGARSLSGMPAVSGGYRRPFLGLPRSTVRAALPTGLPAWDDPHNADLAFARARVRHRVLPILEADLGPGIAAALARTADLLRADADALDAWAGRALAELGVKARRSDPEQRLDLRLLATYPAAVRNRVLRRTAIMAGSPPTDLTAAHVDAIDALVTNWHGQVGADLPGKLRASRSGDELRIGPLD